jgi:hypothetical protein
LNNGSCLEVSEVILKVVQITSKMTVVVDVEDSSRDWSLLRGIMIYHLGHNMILWTASLSVFSPPSLGIFSSRSSNRVWHISSTLRRSQMESAWHGLSI